MADLLISWLMWYAEHLAYLALWLNVAADAASRMQQQQRQQDHEQHPE